MNVFDLSRNLVEEYARFSRSFTKIAAADIKSQLDAQYDSGQFWPEPIVQINPKFLIEGSVHAFVEQKLLHPGCDVIFKDWALRKHQAESIVMDHDGKSFVVTTGTGSGKSLCYFIPIINAALKARTSDSRPRTRAIVIYPMNALANSQLGELDKYFKDVAQDHRVTYARYTGQETEAERRAVADNPPDIILTNFMMLELLLTRQDELDRQVIGNCEGLDYLVLDEIHTYRGRQGADVAMLVRRAKDRLAGGKALTCIGTSATMTSDGGEQGNETVARVASELFATAITKDCVINETLERVTKVDETWESVKPRLAKSINSGVPGNASNAVLAAHPLSVWAETRLGITPETPGGRWVRARPLSLSNAAIELSKDAALSPEVCRGALEQLFLVASKSEKARTGRGSDDPFFGVRLHQFISGAGRAYATIEPPGQRKVVFDGQRFLPGSGGEKALFALHFCHNCGQEHHPVWVKSENDAKTLEQRDIEDRPPTGNRTDAQGRVYGFFMPTPPAGIAFKGEPDDYPDNWVEQARDGTPRLIARYRPYQLENLSVRPDGSTGGGVQGWFQPERFRFCAACGETTGGRGSDTYRLAGLTAEGRSSATTIIIASILKWMHDQNNSIDELKRKILGFTDNRQDGALQAGHFNDFVFVSLLRAAMISALRKAGDDGLEDDQLGRSLQRALGFDQNSPDTYPEWLANPNSEGSTLNDAERAVRDVLAHRVWVDQARTWRVTNPNLERLGLMRVEYKGLDALCKNEEKFKDSHPILRNATPERRKKAFIVLLDHMRKSLAVATDSLEQSSIEALQRRSGLLKAPWALSDERPRIGAALVLGRSQRAQIPADEEVLRVRGGPTSALGRLLSDFSVWGTRLAATDYRTVVFDMLRAAENQIVRKRSMFMGERIENWDIYANAVVFKIGDGVPPDEREPNPFFLEFYQALATMIDGRNRAVFSFEAREHTAQVDNKTRQLREARFRWREPDKKRLKQPEFQEKFHEVADTESFLPVLVCSPTMELGVDIADLDAVYLRNVPPTPANYAQRSGRAGRGGQPALIVTYCAAQSPHDQYFFRDPAAVVKGHVRPPTIDLTNQDLVESHLQAIWLAETRAILNAQIAQVVDLATPDRKLVGEIDAKVGDAEAAERALQRISGILMGLFDNTNRNPAWLGDLSTYAKSIVGRSPARFDEAFDRWRNLLASAEKQYREANETFTRHGATREEHRMAERLRDLAGAQIKLLRDGSESYQSDYYTYRYLATEGFLPGYNFPRLPLTAYVTSGSNRRNQSVIQRPRFLAISEFGPRSLVYHEGRTHRVVRVLLNAGMNTGSGDLTTQRFFICGSCGASHQAPKPEFCHVCNSPLAGCEEIPHCYKIENVQTAPAARVTANDEERQRQGFEIRTGFQWPQRHNGRLDVKNAILEDDEGVIASLTFAPATPIKRFNVGLRRRDPQAGLGFNINPRNGYWERAADDDDADVPADPTRVVPQPIVPYVEDRKNALLLRFGGETRDATEMADLQYAILRGLEMVFQLEEGELLGEALPSRGDRRAILIYEAAEGGAGVLGRIVEDARAFGQVIAEAIRICHFDQPRFACTPDEKDLHDVEGAACVAGCYRCLLSYYNQIDHEAIDRRNPDFKRTLARLARCRMRVEDPAAPSEARPDFVDRFHAAIVAHGIQPFDAKPLAVEGANMPFIWRSGRVVAVYDDELPALASAFQDLSLAVVPLPRGRETEPSVLNTLAAALTGTAK